MLGQSVQVKPVTRDSSLDSTAAESVLLEGKSVHPLSPVHVGASRNDTGDLTMRWIRRSRSGGGWLDGADVPLAEEREAYEIDILDGGKPVRTIAPQTPQAVYTADQQTADFGAVQNAVKVAIYQLSALVGRGEPWTGTL